MMQERKINTFMYMDRMRYMKRLFGGCAVLASVVLFTSCIDEDLSDCGLDYAIDYKMQLSLSLQDVLDKEFVTADEKVLAGMLREDLGSVLSDRAQKLDISFYEVDNEKLSKHSVMMPNANQLSVTFYMDRGDYHNIALASTSTDGDLNISGSSLYQSISLRQPETDTVDVHSSALYMGYEKLTVENQSGRFFVPLYMQNSVPVLVVNKNNSPARTVGAYVCHTASGLMCADSVFIYQNTPVVRTVYNEAGNLVSYHSVCFPSADEAGVRSGDTSDSEGSLWEMELYTQLPDGKYVKNILYMKEPLQAGMMKVIKVKLTDEGEVVSDNPEVGVSVELDWKPGGDFDIEM